jgi:hypothetical protein
LTKGRAPFAFHVTAYRRCIRIIGHAKAGKTACTVDVETAPLPDPQAYQYALDVAEVRRRPLPRPGRLR